MAKTKAKPRLPLNINQDQRTRNILRKILERLDGIDEKIDQLEELHELNYNHYCDIEMLKEEVAKLKKGTS